MGFLSPYPYPLAPNSHPLPFCTVHLFPAPIPVSMFSPLPCTPPHPLLPTSDPRSRCQPDPSSTIPRQYHQGWILYAYHPMLSIDQNAFPIHMLSVMWLRCGGEACGLNCWPTTRHPTPDNKHLAPFNPTPAPLTLPRPLQPHTPRSFYPTLHHLHSSPQLIPQPLTAHTSPLLGRNYGGDPGGPHPCPFSEMPKRVLFEKDIDLILGLINYSARGGWDANQHFFKNMARYVAFLHNWLLHDKNPSCAPAPRFLPSPQQHTIVPVTQYTSRTSKKVCLQ